SFGQLGIAEILDADVLAGVKRLGDPPGDAVQFHANETHVLGSQVEKSPGAATRLQDCRVGGYAQALQGLVHGTGNDRRRIEAIESAALGGVVILGRKQRFQLFAQSLPARILVPTGDRVRKNGQGNRPEAWKTGQDLPFLGSGWPLLLLDTLDDTDGSQDVA